MDSKVTEEPISREYRIMTFDYDCLEVDNENWVFHTVCQDESAQHFVKIPAQTKYSHKRIKNVESGLCLSHTITNWAAVFPCDDFEMGVWEYHLQNGHYMYKFDYGLNCLSIDPGRSYMEIAGCNVEDHNQWFLKVYNDESFIIDEPETANFT